MAQFFGLRWYTRPGARLITVHGIERFIRAGQSRPGKNTTATLTHRDNKLSDQPDTAFYNKYYFTIYTRPPRES